MPASIPPAATDERARFTYEAYGLRIASDVSLAPLLPAAAGDGPPDLRLTLDIPLGERMASDAEFGLPGDMRVLARSGRQAFVQPGPGMGPTMLAELLAGPVLAVLMEQRGAFVLHASAVELGEAVVAFTAVSGGGKSTTAGFLAARGHVVVTDDLLPLRVDGGGVVCAMGPEALKLTATAGEALPELAAAAQLTDKDWRVPTTSRTGEPRRRVSTIYTLETGRQFGVRPLRGHEAVAALIRNSFCLGVVGAARRHAHLQRCADLAARLNVRVLSRPLALDRADELVDVVQADQGATHRPA